MLSRDERGRGGVILWSVKDKLVERGDVLSKFLKRGFEEKEPHIPTAILIYGNH